ncbi:4Fe-4S binding protein [Methanococcoides sp. SA1]|nr:4Fe-4S binding protein [Methanococcoides sp. SA1]
MKELVVISGKGGTGKTTITASFAAMGKNAVIADCDVDAPNLHLLLRPRIIEDHSFYGMDKAEIDLEKCNECYNCQNACKFDAIDDALIINQHICEGCGVCEYVCEADAINMVKKISGTVFESATNHGTMVHAELRIGEETSGKLVSAVKERARSIALENENELIIIDGPPGTGCPVLATITGADLALIVTEPSLSGMHDLERVLQVTEHFDIPAIVCINKYDINERNTRTIEAFCKEREIAVAGKLPYDPTPNMAMREETTVVEYRKNVHSDGIKALWGRVVSELDKEEDSLLRTR